MYRIQADPKLPIARLNGEACEIVSMNLTRPYPYKVRLLRPRDGVGRTLMLKLTELRGPYYES